MPQKIDCDMYAVCKPLKSKMANRLMIRLRSRFGMKMIEDRSVVRRLLAKNTAPGIYLFLADRHLRIREEKYRFEPLNQPAWRSSGVEKLARKTGSAVVYLYILPVETKGHYWIVCSPLCADAGAASEGEITRRYIEHLAENIEEAPHAWLWSHKHWK